jgi:FtsP/CotA-like multicopper oxidase with cupredoxin domain
MLVLLPIVALLIPAAGSRVVSAQSVTPNDGIVCTTSSSPNANFTLTTNTGYITMSDGNTIYMWSFSAGAGTFQYPGPILCVNQGDTVTVVLNNTLSEDVSIVFPGQENVLANGTLAQPQINAGVITSLAPPAASNGGSMTYSFVAGQPGTYVYESGTNPGKQVQMGLLGALVVRPNGHPDWAYDRADTVYNPATESLLILSEVDPTMHQAIEFGRSYDMSKYRPRYWMINGRTFPDTIAPNHASWLPNQPYGSLTKIHPYDSVPYLDAPTNTQPNPAYNPTSALVRYVGFGVDDYPFHPHGNQSAVIGRDGHALEASASQSLSQDMFSIPVGPAQTWDVTFRWTDVEKFDPSNNQIQPQFIPQPQDTTFGQYFSGNPYLGTQSTLPAGTENYNQCGEYFHVAHSHDLHQLTDWGATMSGMATYVRIDPPQPNTCP